MVVLGRMLSVVRWLVGVPAGVAQMPMRRYLPLTALGCLGWNSLLMSLGLVLGRSHAQAEHVVIAASAALIVACCSVAVVVALRRRGIRQHNECSMQARPGLNPPFTISLHKSTRMGNTSRR